MSTSIFKSPLFKVALFGGVAVVGGVAWMERRLQSNFRSQDYYQVPLMMLQKYEPATHYFGRPIYGGKVNLGDENKLKVDGIVAKLSIPIKGPKDKGVLHVLASREKAYDRWTVDQLDLEVSSTSQRWKFYDRGLAAEKNETIPEADVKAEEPLSSQL